MNICCERGKGHIVFYARRYGLANRLRALVGYQAVCRLLDIPFSLCWLRDAAVDAEFTDLFEPETINMVSKHELKYLAARDNVLVCSTPDWFHVLWTRHVPTVEWGRFLACVKECIAELTPVHSVLKKVEDFVRLSGLDDAIGVHIRHTDNLKWYNAWSRTLQDFDISCVSSLSGFISELDRQVVTRSVFVATDNREIEAALKARYGAALTIYPKVYSDIVDNDADATPGDTYRDPKLRTTIEDALIEMLLLGRCRSVLGTYYSSFSEFSAIWGQTEYWEIRGGSTCRDSQIAETVKELRTLTCPLRPARSSRP